MADTREPSMEEILASIRRIITEDGDVPPAPVAAPAVVETEAPAEAAAPDVLELTQPLPEAAADEGLLSQTTAAVASQSLSALSGLVVRNHDGADNTLEALVREMLRPMLREWLDAHLPELVERIVAREVERITRP